MGPRVKFSRNKCLGEGRGTSKLLRTSVCALRWAHNYQIRWMDSNDYDYCVIWEKHFGLVRTRQTDLRSGWVVCIPAARL